MATGGVLALIGTAPATVNFSHPKFASPATFGWWQVHQEFQLVLFQVVSSSRGMFVVDGLLVLAATMFAWPQSRHRGQAAAVLAVATFSLLQLGVALHALYGFDAPWTRNGWHVQFGAGVWFECTASALILSGAAVILVARHTFRPEVQHDDADSPADLRRREILADLRESGTLVSPAGPRAS